MNCQEVIELMQRQLDEDLDAGEKELLAAHLERCSECSKMFERLTLLSNELTNLPKVIPAYSLVDAILPKLGEIDLQEQSSGHDIDSSTSAPAAGPPRTIPWTRRFGSSISWTTAGGVIAAGLIIGFFLFGTNSPLSTQADGLLAPRSNAETAASGTSEKQVEPTPKSQSSADQPRADSRPSSTDQSSKPNVTEPHSAAPKPAGKTVAPSTKPSAQSVTRSNGASVNNEPRDTAAKNGTASGTEAPTTAVPSEAPAASQSPSSAATAEPLFTTKSMEASPSEPAAQPTPAAPEASAVPHPREKDKTGNNTMSISSLMPEETLASKDNKYLAIIEQHQVSIKDNATGGIIFTSTHTWGETDKVSLVVWSDDGKLTYQVSNETSTQNFEIDTVHKTEILLK